MGTLALILACVLGLAGAVHAETAGAAPETTAEQPASQDSAPHDAPVAEPVAQPTQASASSAAPESLEAPATSPAFPAEAALEFEEKLDGRCYILSEGGKLVVMHNRDEASSVRYRLVRLFADRPQMGQTTGVIGPGEQIKLGCSEVDGRRQYWRVERAAFVE